MCCMLNSLSAQLFIQVGFLRSHHKYEILFSLPQVPTLGKDVTLSPALRTTAKPRLRATRITPRPEGMHFRGGLKPAFTIQILPPLNVYIFI